MSVPICDDLERTTRRVKRPILARIAITVIGPDGGEQEVRALARGDAIFNSSNLTADWWLDIAETICRDRWGRGELTETEDGRYYWKEKVD